MYNQKFNRNLKLFVLDLIAFFIIAVMASCSSYNPAMDYAKQHEDKNFYFAMENNESFTLKSYKDDLKALQDKINEAMKKDITEEKKAKLLAEIEALKAKIK